jgi:hypothetical protein
MIELNFEEQFENKLEVNSNRRIMTRNVTQLRSAVLSYPKSKFSVLSTVRKVIKFSRILVSNVSPDFIWKWA